MNPAADVRDGFLWVQVASPASPDATWRNLFCLKGCKSLQIINKVCKGDFVCLNESCDKHYEANRDGSCSRCNEKMSNVQCKDDGQTPNKTVFRCTKCKYIALKYFGKHSCKRLNQGISTETIDVGQPEPSPRDIGAKTEEYDLDTSHSDDTYRLQKVARFLKAPVFVRDFVLDPDKITVHLWDGVNGDIRLLFRKGRRRQCECDYGGCGGDCWHSIWTFKTLGFNCVEDDLVWRDSESDFDAIQEAAVKTRATFESTLQLPDIPSDGRFYAEIVSAYSRDMIKCRTCKTPLTTGMPCIFTHGSMWLWQEKTFTAERKMFFCPIRDCFDSTDKGSTIRNLFDGNVIYAREKIPEEVRVKLYKSKVVLKYE